MEVAKAQQPVDSQRDAFSVSDVNPVLSSLAKGRYILTVVFIDAFAWSYPLPFAGDIVASF
jgi:hypothetical protein